MNWISLTPLVAPRFIKRSGRNTLIGQIFSELSDRGLPSADIEILPLPATKFRNFILTRGPEHARPPQRKGYAVRLCFSQPVLGPIALGYGCHFGLGLFRNFSG